MLDVLKRVWQKLQKLNISTDANSITIAMKRKKLMGGNFFVIFFAVNSFLWRLSYSFFFVTGFIFFLAIPNFFGVCKKKTGVGV